jgi:hypothetical protein
LVEFVKKKIVVFVENNDFFISLYVKIQTFTNSHNITMAEKKQGGFWLNLETIIIGAFFLFFIVWAVQKCNQTAKIKQAELDKENGIQNRDTIERATRTVVTPPAPLTLTPPAQTTVQSIVAPTKPAVIPQTQPVKPTTPSVVKPTEKTLYVTIEGLNVRAEPNLKAKSFGKLKLHDQVAFLDKVTEGTQKLSLGTEEANEPWVKIRTKRGTIGWVYGAGVSYYKTKRKGVL